MLCAMKKKLALTWIVLKNVIKKTAVLPSRLLWCNRCTSQSTLKSWTHCSTEKLTFGAHSSHWCTHFVVHFTGVSLSRHLGCIFAKFSSTDMFLKIVFSGPQVYCIVCNTVSLPTLFMPNMDTKFFIPEKINIFYYLLKLLVSLLVTLGH